MKFRLLTVLISLVLSSLGHSAYAEDYSCLNKPELLSEIPYWNTSEERNLSFLVSRTFKDPGKCILEQDLKVNSDSENFQFKTFVDYSRKWSFPTVWTLTRDGEMVLVTSTFTFPIDLLQALPNRGNAASDNDFSFVNEGLSVSKYVKYKTSSSVSYIQISAALGLRQLWGYWFSKNQGLYSQDCDSPELNLMNDFVVSNNNHKTTWKILEEGKSPRIELSITVDNDCLAFLHTGPLRSATKDWSAFGIQSFAEKPFWDKEGSEYFNDILSKPNSILQVGLGDLVENEGDIFYKNRNYPFYESAIYVKKLPDQLIVHKDSISKVGKTVKVVTTLDLRNFNVSDTGIFTFYVGFYSWYNEPGSSSPSGWRISTSGNSWRATYSKGFSLEGGRHLQYFTRAVKIPFSDLLVSPQEKAAAELKAKAEVAATKAVADAKVAAELKAKIQAEFEELEAQSAKAAATKKTTITCVKGKLTKKVTAVKPKCPSGYKVKK
jgi:hypothetical protein